MYKATIKIPIIAPITTIITGSIIVERPFNQRISFIEKEYNSKNLNTKDDLTVLIIKN